MAKTSIIATAILLTVPNGTSGFDLPPQTVPITVAEKILGCGQIVHTVSGRICFDFLNQPSVIS